MSWLSKALRGASHVIDPVGTKIAETYSEKNDGSGKGLTNFFLPGVNQLNQLDQGAPLTLKTIGDPGNEFNPDEATKASWALPRQQFANSQAAMLGQRQLNIQNRGRSGFTQPTVNYTPAHQTIPQDPQPMSGAPNNIQPNMSPQLLQAQALRQAPQNMGIQPMKGSIV